MKKYLLLILVAVAFTACSTSNDDPVTPPSPDQPIVVNLAKKPDFQIYAGNPNNMIASTLGPIGSTRSGEENSFICERVKNFYVTNTGLYWYDEYRDAMPAEPTEDEKTEIKNYIKNNSDKGVQEFPDCNIFYVDMIGTGGTIYPIPYLYYGEQRVEDVDPGDYISQFVVGGIDNINNYLSYVLMGSPHNFDRALIKKRNPEANYAPFAYYEGFGNGWRDNWKLFEYTYNGTKNYYIGFDYNAGWYMEPDGVYDDMIVKFTPVGNVTPPTPVEATGEVEVNLSMNAEKEQGDYVSSKLSIHVRAYTDVEAYLPVTEENYCAEDDMYIVQKHETGKYVYNTKVETLTMDISGNTVKLIIDYVKADEATTEKPEGIYISTEGINQNVIDYLYGKYGDGITFEIWNYYNGLERTGNNSLQTLLNQSTIKFTSDVAPKTFINAFGKVADYTGTVYDKYVTTTNQSQGETIGYYYPYTKLTITKEDGKDVEHFSEPLDLQYYTRSAAPYQMYYTLNGHKNTLDCTVNATGYTFDRRNDGTQNYNEYFKK